MSQARQAPEREQNQLEVRITIICQTDLAMLLLLALDSQGSLHVCSGLLTFGKR